MYKPYYYQQEILDSIDKNPNKRILVQLATGGGKTVIFTTLAKNYDGKVLILVDSPELVEQTARHFKDAATFEAKDKVFPSDRIVVSMVMTLRSRLKKDADMIKDFDLIIIDECHILQYESLLEIVECKVLGFTATPIHYRKENYYFCFDHKHMSKIKNECCDSKKIEFTKDFAFSDIFDDIIVGISIGDLIKEGYLVQDENYVIPIDEEGFEFDKFGDVTQQSAEKVFDVKYQMDVLANYKEHCQGKKTMIFTQNTTLNLMLYNQFVNEGIENVFMHDSVNETGFSRTDVVEEFRNTDGAILFNVGVFTKGFDVKDVEAIIVSRRISSLALWIQIVGRGSRTATNILKDRFIVVDGGDNINRLDRWSVDHDWRSIFEGSDDYKPKKEAAEEELKYCDNCDELMPERQCICDNCEHQHCEQKEIKIEYAIAVPINIVPPDIDKIIKYCESKNRDKFYALKVLTSQILKMFRSVSKEQFERNLKGGGVDRAIEQYLKPNYLSIIRSSLPSKSNRTYNRQRNILINKLKKHYGVQ